MKTNRVATQGFKTMTITAEAMDFVVYEGTVSPLDEAPCWLNENNWLTDWLFVRANTPSIALQIASLVCDNQHPRTFQIRRIYSKLNTLQEHRSRLIDKSDRFTPQQILESTEYPDNYFFKQSAISKKYLD